MGTIAALKCSLKLIWAGPDCMYKSELMQSYFLYNSYRQFDIILFFKLEKFQAICICPSPN